MGPPLLPGSRTAEPPRVHSFVANAFDPPRESNRESILAGLPASPRVGAVNSVTYSMFENVVMYVLA